MSDHERLVEAAMAVIDKWTNAEDGRKMKYEVLALQRAVNRCSADSPPREFTEERVREIVNLEWREANRRLAALESRLSDLTKEGNQE